MPLAYVNIGSNQGDRRANLARAVALIAESLAVTPQVSSIVASAPWGYTSPNPYLNVGITFTTELAPEALLDALLDAEQAISPAPHRTPTGGYADRAVDIDLIAYDDVAIDCAPTPKGRTLTLPHPRMHLRPFVLAPMEELWPNWIHPHRLLLPADMLAALK